MSQLMDALQAAEKLRQEKARKESELNGCSSPDDGWAFTPVTPSDPQQNPDPQPPQETSSGANRDVVEHPKTEQQTPDLSWNPNLDGDWPLSEAVSSGHGSVSSVLSPQDLKADVTVDGALDLPWDNPNQEPERDRTVKPVSLSASSMFLDLPEDEEEEGVKALSQPSNHALLLSRNPSDFVLSDEEEGASSRPLSQSVPASSSMFLDLPDDEEEEEEAGQKPVPSIDSPVSSTETRSLPSAESLVRSLRGAEIGQGTEEAFAENLQTLMENKKRAKRIQRYNPLLVGGGVLLLLSIVSAGYFLNEMLEPEDNFRPVPRPVGPKPSPPVPRPSDKPSTEAARQSATKQPLGNTAGSVGEQQPVQPVAPPQVEKPKVAQPQIPVGQTPTEPAPDPHVPPAPSPPAPSPVAPSPVAESPVAPSPVAESPVAPSPVAPSPAAESPVAPSPAAPPPVVPSPVAPSPAAPPPVVPSPVVPSPAAPSPAAPSPAAPPPAAPPPVVPSPAAPPPVAPPLVAESPSAPSPSAPSPSAPPPVVPSPPAPSPVAQPSVVQPSVVQPSVVQPPVVQPPVAQPPVLQPPVAQPPVAPFPSAPPPVLPMAMPTLEPPARSVAEKGNRGLEEEGMPVMPSGAKRPSTPQEKNHVVLPMPGMSVLDRASQAFRQGNLDKAKHLFHMALKADPRSHHAMIGLASVGVRRGDLEEARFWYQRVVREDPHNSVAATALLGLNGSGNTASDESQLKHLLRTNPNASHLHFALGNVYAAQQRWTLAYSAYSDANHLSQENNPEVLCNLATSLDHLRRLPEALVYYQKALAIVEERPNIRVSFDVEAVRRRVEVLRRSSGGPTE